MVSLIQIKENPLSLEYGHKYLKQKKLQTLRLKVRLIVAWSRQFPWEFFVSIVAGDKGNISLIFGNYNYNPAYLLPGGG